MKEGSVSSPINAEKRFLQHHHPLELDMLAVSFLKEEKVQPLYPPGDTLLAVALFHQEHSVLFMEMGTVQCGH